MVELRHRLEWNYLLADQLLVGFIFYHNVMAYDLGSIGGVKSLGANKPAKSVVKRKATASIPGVPNVMASGPKMVYGPVYQGKIPAATPPSAPKAPAPKVNTSLSLGSGSGGGSGVTNFDTDGTETESDLKFLKNKQLKAINKNYDIEVSSLKDMENRARGAYGESAAKVESYYPEFQKLVGDQQTSTEGQITGLENTRKYESERALGQARQLLNDLQRRQYAQMSATGNYGSSVPEAFADQFGNKAYAAQSEIQQSRDKSLNELSQKRVEAKQYFDTKLFEGKQKYDTMMQSLQQQLNSQLDQISNAKGKAAQAKNAESLDAWNNYVNNKFSLDQELKNYNNSLMQYAQQTEGDGENPFSEVNASGINNAASGDILPEGQGVGSNVNLNQYTAFNTPIYTKKKMEDPENPFGFQLNNTWA